MFARFICTVAIVDVVIKFGKLFFCAELIFFLNDLHDIYIYGL